MFIILSGYFLSKYLKKLFDSLFEKPPKYALSLFKATA
jgi:hypothetical protein